MIQRTYVASFCFVAMACGAHTPALEKTPLGTVAVVSVSPQTVVANGDPPVVTWTSGVAGDAVVSVAPNIVVVRQKVVANVVNTTTIPLAALLLGENTGGIAVFSANATAAAASFTITLANASSIPVAVLTLTPQGFAFQSLSVGTSANTTLTLSNTGGAAATIPAFTNLGLTAPYSLSASTCATSLAAGASCKLTVTFAPTTTGASQATLTLPYNDGAAGS